MRRALVMPMLIVVAACGRKREPPPPELPPCSAPAPPRRGDATFYDAFVAGGALSCGLPQHDRFVAALNFADYRNAAACGVCLDVVGPAGDRVIVRVADVCPGCKPGDVDLSREAFAKLAPLERGRIQVRWQPVACDVTGPVAYHFKSRSNPFWTGIQVRNHRHPIERVTVKRPTGDVVLARRTYNYFVGQNLGEGPYTLEIVDARGHTQVDTNIALGDDVVRAGSAQLPPCADR